MSVNCNDVAKTAEAVIDAMIAAGANPGDKEVAIKGIVAVTANGRALAELRDAILEIEEDLDHLADTCDQDDLEAVCAILQKVKAISTKGKEYV